LLHGGDTASLRSARQKGEKMAMTTGKNRENAMADFFLGEDVNQTKLRQVEDLQLALHERQAELYRLYETKAIRLEEYVQSFNALLEETFRQCEEILGQEDFLKLFGAPCSQLAGFIDKETMRLLVV
jgi:hypothetical protein